MLQEICTSKLPPPLPCMYLLWSSFTSSCKRILSRSPLPLIHLWLHYEEVLFHLFMYVYIMKKPPFTSSCMSSLWRSLLPPLHVFVYYKETLHQLFANVFNLKKALATSSWMEKKRNIVKLLYKILLSPCKKVTNTIEELCTNTHTLCFWLKVGDVISHVLGFCSTGGWAKEDLAFLSKNDWKNKALYY